MNNNFTEREIKKITKYLQKDDDVLVITSSMACGNGSLAGILTLIVGFLAKQVQEGDIDMGFIEEMPNFVKEATQTDLGKRVGSADELDEENKSKKQSNDITELKDILKSFSDLVDKVNKM